MADSINGVMQGIAGDMQNALPTDFSVTANTATGSGAITSTYATAQNIPAMAYGGIVDSPTVLEAGEAGTEAVVPLGELWEQMQDMISAPINGMSDQVAYLAERIDAIEFGNESTSISDLLRDLQDTGNGGTGDGPEPQNGTPIYYFTYAPQHHFHGGAPSKEDMVEAEHMSQEEFNRMMDQWVKDNARKRF